MRPRLDQLSADQLRGLLELALELLPPSGRRVLLAQLPAPADTRGGPELLEYAHEAIDALLRFLDEREAEVLAAWADDGREHAVERDLAAAWEELDTALEQAARWVEGEPPDPTLRDGVAMLLDALRDLYEWRSPTHGGLAVGDRHPWLASAASLEVWEVLAAEPPHPELELIRRWPIPPDGVRVAFVLGRRLAATRVALSRNADAGDPAAARWLLVESADRGAVLERYRGLAPDLGAAWALAALEDGREAAVADAPSHGVEVPPALLYRALVRDGRLDEAFRVGLAALSVVPAWELWDDAVERGRLDLLRSLARSARDPLARWIGGTEPELLELPSSRYDHEQVKAVVDYACARLWPGQRRSPARSWELPPELVARIAAAPGPHDPRQCALAALGGLSRLVGFHVAGRSRARYARAAAYWRAHEALALEVGLPEVHTALEARFAEDLRRLPALRDELSRPAGG